jgi:hypothetical protein
MWTGYASHCEWCLHQNAHPTCRRLVRSWSDLLTSRGRREAAYLFPLDVRVWPTSDLSFRGWNVGFKSKGGPTFRNHARPLLTLAV